MTNSSGLDTALLVFARHLVDEMRYINYPKEWSRSPLKDLLPRFYDVLNYHPEKLGDLVRHAYEHTFPEAQNGNVNQLGGKMFEPTKGHELFGKTREYYLDEYEIMEPHSDVVALENDRLASKLRELFMVVIDTFAGLTSEQENEHRTLERICFALAPVYIRVQGTKDVGWELAEHADYWRNLSADERTRLKEELTELH